MDSYGKILANRDKAAVDIKLMLHQASLTGINSSWTAREIQQWLEPQKNNAAAVSLIDIQLQNNLIIYH